jgi:hypothetical protein
MAGNQDWLVDSPDGKLVGLQDALETVVTGNTCEVDVHGHDLSQLPADILTGSTQNHLICLLRDAGKHQRRGPCWVRSGPFGANLKVTMTACRRVSSGRGKESRQYIIGCSERRAMNLR